MNMEELVTLTRTDLVWYGFVVSFIMIMYYEIAEIIAAKLDLWLKKRKERRKEKKEEHKQP